MTTHVPGPLTLEQVLADARGEAAVVRKHAPGIANAIDELCDRVRDAAEDWLRWLTMDEAVSRSGHSAGWLRSRAIEWESQGHARREGRSWLLRQCVVPMRANPSASREAGRQAGMRRVG